MALPQTREQLKEYCLRKLGHPVLEINVDNAQLEDRIDEAIAFFQDYHFDGVERIYLKRQLTASRFKTQAIVGTFQQGELIVGDTSGNTGRFYKLEGTDILFTLVTPLDQNGFEADETIIGQQSGASAHLDSDPETFLELGDIDQGSIPTPERVMSIINVFPLQAWSGGASLFNVKYQFALNDMYNLTSTDLISYDMFKRHLALLDELFHGDKPIRHNRKMNRVFLDIDWNNDVAPGQYIIFEALSALDPETYTEMYSDYFMREYTCALFKKQWGANLKKYDGMQLPGGITLNGQKIWDEADQELKELKEQVRKEFENPPMFIVG